MALLVGRALENQGFYHHVNYEYKLRDLETELYQFQYIHHDDSNYYDRPPIPSQFISPSSNKLPSSKKSSDKRNGNTNISIFTLKINYN